MTASRDEFTTKLCLQPGGELWFSEATTAPRRFEGTVEDFVRRCLDHRGVVRMLGLAEHASFLATAYPAGVQLELATPRVCQSIDERQNPAMVIYRMRQCTLPPSLGGWHGMTEQDCASYRLVHAVQTQSPVVFAACVKQHPVWPALSFVPQLNAAAAALALAAIVDPRWHIDPARPDRTARLRRYMGLVPWVQRISQTAIEATPAVHRYRAVMAMWGAGAQGPAAPEDPAQFLWRICRGAGGGRRGRLVASQFLLSFIRYAWLQALSAGWGGGEQLFLPDLLFRSSAELTAYREHYERSQKAV